MTIDLPPPSANQTPGEHMTISRRFIEHAKDELSKGERLQASEKVYGAAQHTLAAIGKERGWRTFDYYRKQNIAHHLAEEFNEPLVRTLHDSFYVYHINFHDSSKDEGSIRGAISDVENFVDAIQRFREAGPQPFTVTEDYQVSRIRQMTGQRVQVGDTSPTGFSNTDPKDDGDAGSPVVPHNPDGGPSAGGGSVGLLPPDGDRGTPHSGIQPPQGEPAPSAEGEEKGLLELPANANCRRLHPAIPDRIRPPKLRTEESDASGTFAEAYLRRHMEARGVKPPSARRRN